MQAAWQSAIPDIWLGDDGVLTIMINIDAGQIEGLYLANQLVLQDMFIQTASAAGLAQFGTMFGLPQGVGTPATGTVRFSGSGNTYIPVGTEIGLDPGAGADVLYFQTTQDGLIPNPGIPTAPVAADSGAAGALTGTFEYLVTFLTATGETTAGAISNAVTVAAHSVNLTNIPLGGPGTTARNIYRALNGVAYQLVATINNNVGTTLTDNNNAPGSQVPPTISTATQVSVTAQSEDNGSQYNAVPGSITNMVNTPDGLTSVTNPVAFVGGSDPEATDTYRSRLLNWIRGPQTGSPTDLVNWAESVQGVSSATCFPNYNGTVPAAGYATVLIAGANGTIASPALIATVLALLQSKTLANITIVVGTFTPVNINVTVTVVPATGYTTAILTPSVQQAVIAYINNVPVAGTLYISGIVAAVLGVSGVNDVIINAPTSNQVAGSQSKFVAGTITVNGTP